MREFELVEKALVDESPPWLALVSQGEKAIFAMAKARFKEIEQLLATTRLSLAVRQRTLVRTKLSKSAGLNDKYIHKQKTPELYAWIDNANQVLEAKALEQGSSRAHLKQTSKMTRARLLARVNELEAEVSRFKKESISTLCRHLLDSELVTTQAEMSASICHLKSELKQALERESHAEERARKWRAAHLASEEQRQAACLELAEAQKRYLRAATLWSEA